MFRESEAEFDGLLKSHMSGKADEQLRKLDNRMSVAFEPESGSEKRYERPQARRGIFARTPAFRLALSHAVIALFFFGIGFYWQFSEQPSDQSQLSTTQTEQSEMASESPESNVGETESSALDLAQPADRQLDQARLLNYSMPRQVDNEQLGDLLGELDGFNIPSAMGAQEESGLASKGQSADEAESVASSDADASAASATTAAAESEAASDTATTSTDDLMWARIMNLFNQMAVQQDGYLVALTNNSLVRVNLSDVEVLLSDLQNPAGWSFGEEGEIIVFDRDGQEPVFWKLNRIDILEESDN